MISKPPESDDAAGPSSTVQASPEPSSSAEPAAVTRSLADAMGGIASSPDVGGQKGVEDGAKTPRNSGKRRDKSKSVEPSEPPVDRLFSERVVTVLVGPSEVQWRLHENLLSGISDFFRSAFNSGFKESLEDRLAMPEDDPHSFELFIRWLYIRTLTPTAVSNSTLAANVMLGKDFTAGSSTACIQDYLRLYVLASKVLVEELENACVDMAHAFYSVGMRRPDIKDVQYVYEHTMPGCGMRRLLKERLTMSLFKGKQHNPVTPEWREIMNETPDLGYDIVSEIASYNWIGGGNASAKTPAHECTFHRHDRSNMCARLSP
ncbi:hypothetical protein SLS64_000107 [Diaporthe eres]|uniref:BTB domain-containing protein n=1 Tax=Diaporthe eres TaxID=83184 RepID=A0ABR1P5C5_DIAER